MIDRMARFEWGFCHSTDLSLVLIHQQTDPGAAKNRNQKHGPQCNGRKLVIRAAFEVR
jgi:hypothetical protein